MKAGDVVIIPPGVKHKFINSGEEPAVTFNVYSPPEYPVDEKRVSDLQPVARIRAFERL